MHKLPDTPERALDHCIVTNKIKSIKDKCDGPGCTVSINTGKRPADPTIVPPITFEAPPPGPRTSTLGTTIGRVYEAFTDLRGAVSAVEKDIKVLHDSLKLAGRNGLLELDIKQLEMLADIMTDLGLGIYSDADLIMKGYDCTKNVIGEQRVEYLKLLKKHFKWNAEGTAMEAEFTNYKGQTEKVSIPKNSNYTMTSLEIALNKLLNNNNNKQEETTK